MGYCRYHVKNLDHVRRRRGFNEKTWRQTQRPFPSLPTCAIPRCVHDGEHYATNVFNSRPMCQVHYEQWLKWLEISERDRDDAAWTAWSAMAADDEYLKPASSRGEVTLAHLPDRLQHEIRYAIDRHAKTAERTHWRPVDIQKVVNALAEAGIQSLSERAVAELQQRSKQGTGERRVWLRLPLAARSLSVSSATAKADGWFDPVIVGATQFPHTGGHRRKVWDLTKVSQRWLRDLLWEHLQHEALKQTGRRTGATTISARIRGITLLSRILYQNRSDHGEEARLFGETDAKAVKDTLDVWYRDRDLRRNLQGQRHHAHSGLVSQVHIRDPNRVGAEPQTKPHRPRAGLIHCRLARVFRSKERPAATAAELRGFPAPRQ